MGGAVWVCLLATIAFQCAVDGRDVIATVEKSSFNTGSSSFGFRARGGADMDGDGVGDVVVGILFYDWGGGVNYNAGGAQILYLNADGTVAASSDIFDIPSNRSTSSRFGTGVDGSCGDINGDGFTDLVVGSYGLSAYRGAAFLMAGTGSRTTAPSTVLLSLHDNVGNYTLNFGDCFGGSVACVGDIDGNGVVDIAVGAYGDDSGGQETGAVYVFLLENNGTSVKSVLKHHTSVGELTIQSGSFFGSGLGGIGDLDGDGVPDLAVGASSHDIPGASRAGAVYVLFLDSDGGVREATLITAGEGGFTGDLNASNYFGSSVDGIGDMDHDGVPDILVRATNDDSPELSDSGAAYLLLMTSGGIVKETIKISAGQVGFNTTLGSYGYFGSGVGRIGDINGDGVLDYVIGAHGDDEGGINAGAIYIVLSDPAVLTPSQTPSSSPSPSLTPSLSLSSSPSPSASPSLTPSLSPSYSPSTSPSPSVTAAPFDLSVTVFSNNPHSTQVATTGDTVFVDLQASVSVFDPSVTVSFISSDRIIYQSLSANNSLWRASFTVLDSDDSAGNSLDVSAIVYNSNSHSVAKSVYGTDSTTVLIDTVPPRIVSVALSSTNPHTNTTATIADQMMLRITLSEIGTVNRIAMLGDEANVTIEGEGTSQLILSRTVDEATPSGPVTYSAVLMDIAGNQLSLNCSSLELFLPTGRNECRYAMVDRSGPVPTSLKVYSNNFFTRALARIGDTVTVEVEADEAIAKVDGSTLYGVSIVDVVGLNTANVSLQFNVTEDMQGGDLWFDLLLHDLVGNEALYSNITTDNSTVSIVTSEPILFVIMRGAGQSLFNVVGGDEVIVSVEASAPISNVSVTVNGNPVLSIFPGSGYATRFTAIYRVRDDEPIGAMDVVTLFADLNGNPSRYVGVSDGQQIRPQCAVGYVKDNSTFVCGRVECPESTIGWPACRCVDGMGGQTTFQHGAGYSANCAACEAGHVSERVEDVCSFENETTSTQTICMRQLCPGNSVPDSFPDCECDISRGYYGRIEFQPVGGVGYIGVCVECSDCGFFRAERQACTATEDVGCYSLLESMSVFVFFLVVLGVPSLGAIWSMSRFTTKGDSNLSIQAHNATTTHWRPKLGRSLRETKAMDLVSTPNKPSFTQGRSGKRMSAKKVRWKKIKNSLKALYGYLDAASDVSFVMFSARGVYQVASAVFVVVPLLSCLVFSVTFFVRAFWHMNTFGQDFLSDRTRRKLGNKLHHLLWILLAVSFNPRLIEVFLHSNYPIRDTTSNSAWARRLHIFPSAMIILENLPQIIIQITFASSEQLSFFVLFSLIFSIVSLGFEFLLLVAYLRQRWRGTTYGGVAVSSGHLDGSGTLPIEASPTLAPTLAQATSTSTDRTIGPSRARRRARLNEDLSVRNGEQGKVEMADLGSGGHVASDEGEERNDRAIQVEGTFQRDLCAELKDRLAAAERERISQQQIISSLKAEKVTLEANQRSKVLMLQQTISSLKEELRFLREAK